ncbi:MAG: GTP cyclohydrolase II [Candidatus Poseidoniales archaeon]|nr:MAG: GTP cyclohydrolase II [Candidatus Poseidoniales archaeon]
MRESTLSESRSDRLLGYCSKGTFLSVITVSGQYGVNELGEIPADARLPTSFGDFRIRVFHEENTGLDHVALTLGDMIGPDPVLVRVHSECLTGDAFGSLRCDCGAQLEAAMRQIHDVGWGCIIYLRQEGRGIGLHAKIQAYNLQDHGADTLDANLLLGHPADARDYGIASEILGSIGIEKVCLLTNNPDKVVQLVQNGVNIVERMPLVVGVREQNLQYLTTKIDRMGHEIEDERLNGHRQ